MKQNFLSFLCLLAISAIIGISCTKESASTISQPPASTAQTAMQTDNLTAATVTPGIYIVHKFIDTGDDITTTYNGYTFKFKADGTLVATHNGNTFRGTWKLKNQGKQMAINISGNKALKNLSDDSWNVNFITNLKINLKKPGPDQLVFVMQ
jgi:hypothetical protein